MAGAPDVNSVVRESHLFAAVRVVVRERADKARPLLRPAPAEPCRGAVNVIAPLRRHLDSLRLRSSTVRVYRAGQRSSRSCAW